jgi:hypothetical protein
MHCKAKAVLCGFVAVFDAAAMVANHPAQAACFTCSVESTNGFAV